ncbi:Mu transposase C-terminal domain-containing protein [Bradyrhizobium sp. S3.5.5]|uniref:Mu transposase C-terminal domain-containing protein n=1 Tax=Bradyrhizobium sp. S3.5.5 TaxID=3156430 RepID=UPI00339641BF
MYAFKKQPRRFAFGPLDRIIIRYREYRWVSSDEFGHVLSPMLGVGEPISEGFSHEYLDEIVEKGELKHEPSYYEESRALTRLKNGGAISLFDLSPDQQKQLLVRQEILDLIRQEEVTDPGFVRTDGHLKKVLSRIMVTLVERNQARAAEGKAERSDQRFEMTKLPSPRTVRRWWKPYEASGFDIMSLRDGHHRSGNPYSSLHPDVLQLIDKHAAGYCDRRRPTMAAQYDALSEEIRRINEARPDSAKLSIPAKGTFRKAIKAIPAFDAYAGRFGLDAAKRKFAVVGQGMESVRAFQRLVMDGHKTQISTIAVRISNWASLSPEEKKKAERERLVLHLSICAASRCITGIRFSKTENKETAKALLRMSVTDKKRYAAAAKCKSDWPMTARPASIHTDTGGAWISTEFRGCVADLRCTLETAPVGLPQMRGHAERVFGTIDRSLLPNFTGRTFGSIEEKGDDNPAAEASIFSESIGSAFVRYVVDRYHHTPHAALCGMTPYNKWLELVERYAVLPPPGRDEIRNIFGPRIERALDHRGVRVAAIHYQSARLQEYRRKVGDAKVAVKFDPEDLGRVSVWIDDAWLTVPAIVGSLDGVHLDHWSEAIKDLRRRNLIQSSLSRHYVDGAIRDLASMGRLALSFADVSAPTLTADDLERVERELLYGFDIVDPDDGGAPESANASDRSGSNERFANAIPVTDPPPGDDGTQRSTEPETPDGPPGKPTVRTRKPNLKLED